MRQVRGSPCLQEGVREEDEEEFLLRAGRQRWSTVLTSRHKGEHRLLLAIKHRLHHPFPSPSTTELSTRALRSSSPFWGALALQSPPLASQTAAVHAIYNLKCSPSAPKSVVTYSPFCVMTIPLFPSFICLISHTQRPCRFYQFCQ